MAEFRQIKDTYRYKSVEVAFYIVAWANAHRVTINLTKTQKLLYIAYGAYLVLNDNRLCDEHAQAWPYGPVFPRTRNKLLHVDIPSITMEHKELESVKDDEDLAELIAFVFKGFGEYTAGQLTIWSHRENTPWDKATKRNDFDWGDEIPDTYIADYFAGLINGKEKN